MAALVQILVTPIAIMWALASPVTYILAVVHTWHGTGSVPWKLFLNLTIDMAISAIWPVAWTTWAIMHYMGHNTPLRLLFG